MGTLGKCPHCKENIYLGSGFNGPTYQNTDGTPFDPLLAEECPKCGSKVKKNEWLAAEMFMLWD